MKTTFDYNFDKIKHLNSMDWIHINTETKRSCRFKKLLDSSTTCKLVILITLVNRAGRVIRWNDRSFPNERNDQERLHRSEKKRTLRTRS